jgi:hypothetical protein
MVARRRSLADLRQEAAQHLSSCFHQTFFTILPCSSPFNPCPIGDGANGTKVPSVLPFHLFDCFGSQLFIQIMSCYVRRHISPGIRQHDSEGKQRQGF